MVRRDQPGADDSSGPPDRREGDDGDLQRLFDLSLDLLCVAGNDGYFKRINPAFQRILGYEPGELLSRRFIEFVHPDDRERTLEATRRLAEGLPVVDFENRYRARDGTYRWLAWRSAPQPDLGLVYAVARDITVQKQAQEQLARQTRELARSNADLERFASAASHDLRAPLRGIGNLIDWLEEELEGGTGEPADGVAGAAASPGEGGGAPLSAAAREHLAELRAQVRRMEKLIDDLLAYARAGQRRGEVRQVKVAEMVRKVAVMLALPEGFDVVPAPDLPELTTAAAPLEQVLRNLVGNAVQHHDRSTGRVEVSARRLDGLVEFRVADDGPGIPDDEREKVFTMFRTLAGGGGGGTGMGLALVRRIVESHGGSIRVEPGRDRGTTISFTWPVDTSSG